MKHLKIFHEDNRTAYLHSKTNWKKEERQYYMETLAQFLQEITDEGFEVKLRDVSKPAHLPTFAIKIYFNDENSFDFKKFKQVLDQNILITKLTKDFIQRVEGLNEFNIDTSWLILENSGAKPRFMYDITIKAKDEPTR